jgi:HEAT repeat protein
MLSDVYDIPEEVARRPHSRAFEQFLQTWFGNSYPLTRGEVDLSFLNDLTSEEREVAKDLLRRNLKLRYSHVIEGVAALDDSDSIPILKMMLAGEPNASRQLTIIGALWKLNKDVAFVDYLNRMKSGKDATLKQAHVHRILWLGDGRTIDLLIDLLDDEDGFVRFLALSTLNELEFESHFLIPEKQLPSRPDHYRSPKDDAVFRAMMTSHLQARNAAVKNGR